MLVLERKVGESLNIGDDIMIKVLGYRQGSIRIGIDAPKSIKILREELMKQVYAEQPCLKRKSMSDYR